MCVALAAIVGAVIGSGAAESPRSVASPTDATTWVPQEIALTASAPRDWWEFPVRAIFTHQITGQTITVDGFWSGDRNWVIRFVVPRSGVWTYSTISDDRELGGWTGTIRASEPTPAEFTRNPNLHGLLRIGAGGRHFTYADGTPFLLLADTIWAVNTARCGLGAADDGPFFQYLADRKAKGFTALLMQYFHGYGDYPDAPGHRNEGGQAFHARDASQLNARHFQALDRRMRALWDAGFVAAVNTTWWAKTRECLFKPEDARRISAYCAVRYGAFNALWSLSGEYQYAFKDCGWTAADFTGLGEYVQAHNPWRHPLSVHPSARLDWPAPHNVQSSRPFHGQSWLDHHWLQTGQSRDRLFNVVTRLRDDRALEPPTPVFLAEAYYESGDDAESRYHARWQVWTAFLNGAAGYGYGADGIWQFYDPADPTGEKGKNVKGVKPWREALRYPGSTQLAAARKFLEPLEWWKLAPQRDRVRIDGARNPLPAATDLSPPHLAVMRDGTAVLYVPRGNETRALAINLGPGGAAVARWYDPRRGEFLGANFSTTAGWWTIPSRPVPAEDWVMMLEPVLRTVK